MDSLLCVSEKTDLLFQYMRTTPQIFQFTLVYKMKKVKRKNMGIVFKYHKIIFISFTSRCFLFSRDLSYSSIPGKSERIAKLGENDNLQASFQNACL